MKINKRKISVLLILMLVLTSVAACTQKTELSLEEIQDILIKEYKEELKDGDKIIIVDSKKDGDKYLVDYLIEDKLEGSVSIGLDKKVERIEDKEITDKVDNENDEDVNTSELGGLEDIDITTLTTDSDIKDIISALYTSLKDDHKEDIEAITNMHMLTKLSDENMEYMLGGKYEFKEGYVSESGIGTHPYSLIVIRANDEKDSAKLKSDIEKSVNPAKWICVQAESVDGAENNDLVVVVMGDKNITKDMVEVFKTIK